MRNKKRLLAVLATTTAAVMSMGIMSSCSVIESGLNWLKNQINAMQPLTDEPLQADTLADFTKGEADTFFSSNGWTNGSPFNSWWSEDKVAYADEALKLSISKNPDGSEANCDEYFGGEARSHQYFGYGDFEVRMKPSKAGGTASTFFTCTGPYDTDAEGNPNPHDEIDIEFLGKDTTHVQFNYFVNGQGGHEYMYNLGFDASEEFHNYGYRWTEDYIVWFVDGKPVYKVEASASNPLPTTPGRILMNYWTGNKEAEGWMGKYTGKDSDVSEYQWVRTSATPIGELPGAGEGEGGGNEGGDAIVPEGEKRELAFTGNDHYVLDKEGVAASSVTASYTDIAGNSYHAFEANVAELAAGNDTFALNIKNNGTEAVHARVDLVGTTTVGNTNVCNLSAQAIGGSDVRTDLTWGGSFVTVAGGETATLVVKYDGEGEHGAVQKLAIFLDSSTNESTVYSGNVTISDFIFASTGNDEGGNEGGDTPVTPPVDLEGKAELDLSTALLEGNVTDGYVVTKDEANKAITLAYTDMLGNCYKNINVNVSSIASTRNVFHVTVKNNGAQTAKLRVDVNSEKKVNETNACNVSATMNGGEVYTDTTWGGSTFTLEAGATAEITVTYDPARKPTNVMFYVDSSQYDDSTTHTGSITLSGAYFDGEAADTPVEPPVTEGTQLTFNDGEGTYTVDKNGVAASEINVTYTGIAGNTYKPMLAEASALAAGHNTFSATFTNNGATDVRARIDLQGQTWVSTGEGSGTDACNLSSTGSDSWTDTTWGGTSFTVPAGQSVTITVTYTNKGAQGAVKNILFFFDTARGEAGPYSGNITVKDFSFTGEESSESAKTELAFNNANGIFNVDKNGVAASELNVTYTGIAGNTWTPMVAEASALAAGNNTFAITFTNNGTADVRARVDLQGTNSVSTGEGSSTDACNLSSTGGDSWTDTTWGGTSVTVKAGESVTIVITYSNDNAQGAVKNVLLFLDNARGDEGPYSGNVTVNGFEFSNK